MSVEWRNKTENPVEIRRSSATANGGLLLILGFRVRQPFMAKELLCGNQPANLSLVIAVFRFPSYFVVLPHYFFVNKEVKIVNKYFIFS